MIYLYGLILQFYNYTLYFNYNMKFTATVTSAWSHLAKVTLGGVMSHFDH